MKAIATARLDLEPVTPANAAELWRLLQMPDLREFQDIPRIPLAEFERQVRSRPTVLKPGATGRFEWLIRVRETHHGIGWLSLRINERTRDVAELGYSLIAEARGKGYATEALRALVAEAFDATDLSELDACIIPENHASAHVLERTGFLEQRVLRGGTLVRGKRVDIVLYALNRGARTQQRRALG